MKSFGIFAKRFVTEVPIISENQSTDFQSKSMDWFLYDRDSVIKVLTVFKLFWPYLTFTQNYKATHLFNLLKLSILNRLGGVGSMSNIGYVGRVGPKILV